LRTFTVSPALALFTAAWMDLKSQPFLQTVCFLNGPFGLDATGPGSFGSGYVWALAAGANSANVSAAISAVRISLL
jgi:hypothetical protein